MRQSIEQVALLHAKSIGQAEGIRLRPTQGYLGDAPVDEATLNAQTFFFVDEWMEK